MAVRKAKPASGSAQRGRAKKTSPKKTKRPYSWAVLFWLAFIIFIFGLFIFNREAISGGIRTIGGEITSRKTSEDEAVPPFSDDPGPAPPQKEEKKSAPPAPAVTAKPTPQPTPAAPVPAPKAAQPVTPPVAAPAATATPAAPVTASQAAQTPAEVRERVLYFTQVDRGGSILRIKVNRKLPVSDSPMTDVLKALIAGPNADEKGKGLISLIPPAARVISASIRGDTAYVNFSEDFQYNTYGVEGYAGQLAQVVFTATEFPNVKNVQILIDGRRLDYLGEGIWIGSPLSRESL